MRSNGVMNPSPVGRVTLDGSQKNMLFAKSEPPITGILMANLRRSAFLGRTSRCNGPPSRFFSLPKHAEIMIST
jgi:hypothetical protein